MDWSRFAARMDWRRFCSKNGEGMRVFAAKTGVDAGFASQEWWWERVCSKKMGGSEGLQAKNGLAIRGFCPPPPLPPPPSKKWVGEGFGSKGMGGTEGVASKRMEGFWKQDYGQLEGDLKKGLQQEWTRGMWDISSTYWTMVTEGGTNRQLDIGRVACIAKSYGTLEKFDSDKPNLGPREAGLYKQHPEIDGLRENYLNPSHFKDYSKYC
ncbi:hypothetical protein SDJN03_22843, partial [Cucurbita argyrosperma subsp. sororia]